MKGFIYLLEQVPSDPQKQDFLKTVIDHLFCYKDIYELIVFIFLFITFLLAVILLIFSRVIVNKKSKYEYEKNERNGKFVNELYIELGNNNEKLRYMFYSKKWKSRVFKEFYGILHTRTGKMIAKKCKIKIFNYITFKGLHKSLIKVNNFLENLRKSKGYYDDERNLMFFIDTNSYYLKDSLERLIDYTEMMNSNVCFLLGKAGSGKTNLLTYFAKYLIIDKKVPCIYIDAKDVSNNDIDSIFLSYFYFSFIINESKKILINVLLFLKKIFKQKIVVIIDAINENSDKDFCKNLSTFINKYRKYQNIKIIVSSRTEFFDLRFKDIFDEYLEKNVKYNISTIENSKITENVHEKMYLKYKKYFKFDGSITNSVKRILFESPIFMRIFFECYNESDANITDINKSKIFSEYISKLSKIYPNLYKILNEIIEQMISSKKFDYVYIDKLECSIDDISNLIYENVLLTHSIVENDNQVNEIKRDVILITFDEIRDYLITNSLIEKYKSKNINIVNFIDEMIENRYPILEGVLKNLYIYFKKKDVNICKNILKKKIFNGYNYGNKDTYRDVHLEFIFSAKEKLEQFEIDYLLKLDYLDPRDLAKMIFDSSYNQLYDLQPNTDFIKGRMQEFIKGKEKIYDFSRIHRSFYINIINYLEKMKNRSLQKYINLIRNLLNVLEADYYE